MKHAFITGASGFIGGYLAEEFVKRGWWVTALIHRSKSDRLARLRATGRLRLVEGDVRDYASLGVALRQGGSVPDAFIHCAGRASDVGWRSEFRQANLDGVRHAVRLSKEMDIGCLVFISSTDVYGIHDFDGQDEDGLDLRAHPRNPYPEYKIRAERHIRAELPQERYSILRPAQVWGVGDTTLTKRIVDFLECSPWIVHFGKWHGGNRWPLAHVRNVALAAYLAATLPEARGRAINVCDSERTSIDQFYRHIAGIYMPEKRFGTLSLPFWAGFVFGAFVSAISNLFNLSRPFADPSLYALYSVSRNLDFSNETFLRLATDAGEKLVTLDEGLRELRQAAKNGI